MDKLKVIPQETKTDLLQTAPVQPPTSYIPPGKCPWIKEKGDTKGEPCNEKTFDGNVYCEAHLVVSTRREAKKAAKLESSKEVNVSIKTSEPTVPIIQILEPPAPPNTPQPSFQSPLLLPPALALPITNTDIGQEILAIIKNFSISIVNLTEILKK